VHIIPSELDLAGAEIDVARMDGYLQGLSMAMLPLVRNGGYDFILIDCPPSLGVLTMNALTAADGLLLPIQCEYYALEGLSVITHIVEQLRTSRANPGIEIQGIVMTMFDARTRLSQDVASEVRSHFGDTRLPDHDPAQCPPQRSTQLRQTRDHVRSALHRIRSLPADDTRTHGAGDETSHAPGRIHFTGANRYLKMHQRARIPSFQVIFLPSA
jgi:cellulose biosynthesis protein BcsQ